MSNLLITIIVPSDIEAVQSRLKASADGTNETVKACAGMDAPTKASWSFFYATVSTFSAIPIHWYANTTHTLYERGLDLEKELLEWQELIISRGCTLTVPLHDPTPPPPPLTDALRWAAIAAASIAGIYGISKVIEIIPKWKSSRAAPAVKAK